MSEQSRTPSGKLVRDPGPYLAKVVNHLDAKFMGTLEVELLKIVSSGNSTQGTGEIITVKYKLLILEQNKVINKKIIIYSVNVYKEGLYSKK